MQFLQLTVVTLRTALQENQYKLHITLYNMQMRTAKRESIVPPPPASGTFKIEKNDEGDIIATPTRNGKKFSDKPSHVHDQVDGS